MSAVAPTSAVRSTLSELLTLAWPVVLARIGIMTMGLTDAIVVGNAASRELAFHSLAWAPHSIVVVTAVGLLFGVQVMTARLIGEGRRDEVGAVLRRGLTYGLQLGVAAALALIVLGPWVLGHLNLEAGLAAGATPVLIVFALSMPAYLISVAAQFFLEALGMPKPGMVAIWVANGVNLALNLLLVPDLPGIGLHGATASAWATFTARAVLAVFLVVYIARLPQARALGVFDRPKPDPATAREQRRVGYGGGSSYFIEVTAFAAMTVFAGQLGSNETAAWAIVLNVSAIVFMVPMGLSSASAVLVGRAHGARDGAGALRAGLTAFAVVAGLTLAVAVCVWPSAGVLVGVYNRDPALLMIAAPALALAALFFVADGVQVVAAQSVRAAGDVWWPTILHFVSYAAVMIPLGWWLSPRLGVNGLVWAVIIASLTSASLLVYRFVRVARRVA